MTLDLSLRSILSRYPEHSLNYPTAINPNATIRGSNCIINCACALAWANLLSCTMRIPLPTDELSDESCNCTADEREVARRELANRTPPPPAVTPLGRSSRLSLWSLLLCLSPRPPSLRGFHYRRGAEVPSDCSVQLEPLLISSLVPYLHARVMHGFTARFYYFVLIFDNFNERRRNAGGRNFHALHREHRFAVVIAVSRRGERRRLISV